MTKSNHIIVIGDKEYATADLPPDIQNLLNIYAIWENELKTAKVEVFKLEAAIKSLSSEIEIRLKQYESTPQVP